jgi:hypothetical protein
MGHRQAGLLGERDELLDGIESMLVLESSWSGLPTAAPGIIAPSAWRLTSMPVRPRVRYSMGFS